MPDSLSPLQRLKLIRLVNALPLTEFDELLFALKPKDGVVPPNVSAQGNRAKALLGWVEGPTGCGLTPFLEVLDAVAPGTFIVELSPPETPTQPVVPVASKAPEPTLTVDLGSGVTLAMVYIPKGRFWMGSPENEPERRDTEGPQHKVTVPAFYMGKYPVTQRQWRAVSLLDDVEQALAPDPSCFKGDDLPVERVNWFEAVEFCQRLSQYTRHEYRLPSEAEWEYACRAGTSTPFAFGKTITTDLANYRGTDWEYGGKTYSGAYGDGPHGEFREATTEVGSFDVANAFGLYDMHGNVWEWCQDHWYGSYEGAPTNGGAWLSPGEGEARTLRGGSWSDFPRNCRSASRLNFNPGLRDYSFGFRVVCRAPRT